MAMTTAGERTNEDLFRLLCAHLGVEPDRSGEAHINCPLCGKAAVRGQTHFSFSVRGGKCFVCGGGIGLYTLAMQSGLYQARPELEHKYLRPAAPPRKVETPWDDKRDYSWHLDRYAHHPDRMRLWQTYKPLPAQVIKAYKLGVGAFPEYTSKCPHERLMVPIISAGKVIGFRGRSLGCDCGKWLSNKGYEVTLFNGERLVDGPRRSFGWAPGDRSAMGRWVVIVENPIDAILLEYVDSRKVAVATCSVSYWQDDWTEALASSRCKGVCVAYDNDRPGNGGGEVGRISWITEHGRDIEPNGIRLANRLLRAGVTVRLSPWGDSPARADVGDLLTTAVRSDETLASPAPK